MLENQKADSWRKTLKFISHCPVCSYDYKSEAGKLFVNKNDKAEHGEARYNHPHVGEAMLGEAKFVHFTCDHCQSNFMAMIMTMPKGMSTIGMVTDLNFKDVQKLHKMPPLTIDEIIEGHKFINSPGFKI